ncbi:hypothetical protein F5B19DRAFT_179095 [Rostrohypoxylon terebratum]|nr:hypothetical protein F5B19DRAFT_179095 [Rostrohypoxylon terebratum]
MFQAFIIYIYFYSLHESGQKMPICDVCRKGFEGIWDPSKTRRVCTTNEWKKFADLPNNPWDMPENPPEDMERYHFPEFIFGHHATEETFIQAVDEGCLVCKAVDISATGDEEINHEVSTLGYYTFLNVSQKKSMSKITIGIYKKGMWLTFFIAPHNFSDTILKPATISPFTGDEDTWGTILGWLSQCLERHTLCDQRDTTLYIPSRLIRLNNTAMEPTFFRCRTRPSRFTK